MRHQWVYKSTIASVLVALVFCGFGCKGLSKTEQQLVQPITLEYWTVFDDVDAIRAEIAKYQVGRPYLTVNVRQLRANEIYPRLVEALAEDRGPDIISVRNRSLKAYVSKLAPMPSTALDTTVTITKTQLGTNTAVTPSTRVLPTLLTLDRDFVKTVKSDVVVDGKIYGLPLSLDVLAVYYNKDLLDRSGVPEPPKTWEEFQAAVKKISKFDKITGKVTQAGAALGSGSNVPSVDDLLYVLFRQSGIPFSGQSGQAQFAGGGENSPVKDVMNFYTDFSNPTRDTYTWNTGMGNALDEFVNGKVGFFIGYSYNYDTIKARAPQLNLGVLPLFQLNPDKPVNAANYWIQTVVSKSKNQNAAWSLIDHLTRTAAAKSYLDATLRPTALRGLIAGQKENPELEPFVSGVLSAENWYRGTNYDAAQKAVADMADEWIKTPADERQENEYRQNVLNRAAAKINQSL